MKHEGWLLQRTNCSQPLPLFHTSACTFCKYVKFLWNNVGQRVYLWTACPDTHPGKWDNLGVLESRGFFWTCYWSGCYYIAFWTIFRSTYSFVGLTSESTLVLHKLEYISLAMGSLEAGSYTEVRMWLSSILSRVPVLAGTIPALRSSESATASKAKK